MALWITLASAFRFTRRSSRLWVLGVVAFLGSAALVVVQPGDTVPVFASNTELRVWLAGSSGRAALVVGCTVIAVMGLWLGAELASGALVCAADAPLRGEALSLREAIRAGARVWRRVIAVDTLVVVPVLVPLAALAALGSAALDAGQAADISGRVFDFVTSGMYDGFAVALGIVVWAWRDLAVRHAVLDDKPPMEAVHEAVADLTGAFVRAFWMGAVLFVTSWLVTFLLIPMAAVLSALDQSGAVLLTPTLAWQWMVLPGAIIIGPYALFDAAAWTYFYRLLHPTATEVSDA